MHHFTFPAPRDDPAIERLREEVRDFLSQTLADRPAIARAESWNGFDREFSRGMGQQGWLGMTWPSRYGGHERSAFERYVVVEEVLAAGAPVAAHWIAERQSGPTLLKFGTEAQRLAIMPRIAAGECCFCIGMSEPDSGSDLAAVRTRAVPADGGYRVTGTKLWTTNAHEADYMILFCRTSGDSSSRHEGTSQLLVDMRTPGINVRPITDLAGKRDFNEVFFDDVFIPASALIGKEGDGWRQVMSELAHERSGPERFLSSFTMFVELVRVLASNPSDHARIAVGRLAAHLVTLRRLSRGVAALLDSGEDPQLHASLVKSLGSLCEQEIPEIARQIVEGSTDESGLADFRQVLEHCIMMAPAYSLRGGTREILRGIIARGLGVR